MTITPSWCAPPPRYSAAPTPPNTTRTYDSAWRAFETWCERHRVDRAPGHPAHVDRTPGHPRRRRGRRLPLAVRVAAIAARHSRVGHPGPTLDSGVSAVLDGVRALATRAGRTGAAPPASIWDCENRSRALHPLRLPITRNRCFLERTTR
ncbi:hypothetical protein [Nocardia noduli]|uniref:hypothetical protein n=1 Tax=Nocardia noduli TaxID=2815722 RepID=UPI001C24A43E|nr:hypothetical protein [Nocardia noduli]